MRRLCAGGVEQNYGWRPKGAALPAGCACGRGVGGTVVLRPIGAGSGVEPARRRNSGCEYNNPERRTLQEPAPCQMRHAQMLFGGGLRLCCRHEPLRHSMTSSVDGDCNRKRGGRKTVLCLPTGLRIICVLLTAMQYPWERPKSLNSRPSSACCCAEVTGSCDYYTRLFVKIGGILA